MFYKWFHKSEEDKLRLKAKKAVKGTKVVDNKGNPIVIYHGIPKEGQNPKKWNFYFSEDKNAANSYAGKGGKVLVGYIYIKNMVEFDFNGKFFNQYNGNLSTDEIALKVAKEGKYDGIKFKNIIDFGGKIKSFKDLKPSNEYVIFNPKNFKGFKKII